MYVRRKRKTTVPSVKTSNYRSKQHTISHRFVVLELRNQVIYPAGSPPSHGTPSCTVPALLQLRVGKATAVHEVGMRSLDRKSIRQFPIQYA